MLCCEIVAGISRSVLHLIQNNNHLTFLICNSGLNVVQGSWYCWHRGWKVL